MMYKIAPGVLISWNKRLFLCASLRKSMWGNSTGIGLSVVAFSLLQEKNM